MAREQRDIGKRNTSNMLNVDTQTEEAKRVSIEQHILNICESNNQDAIAFFYVFYSSFQISDLEYFEQIKQTDLVFYY